MSIKKVEPIKSHGKKKRELEKTVSLIKQYHEHYMSEILYSASRIRPGDKRETLLNPKDEEVRRIASDYFTEKTASLRNEIKTYVALGYQEEDALKRVLPKAFAVVRAASDFLWKKVHYDVQLMGGILLNDGYASEMATGEGKTLTAALPIYLNALMGRGAQVITPNGYLAMRDAKEMGELYNLVGLTCGLVEERKKLAAEEIEEKIKGILAVKIKKYCSSGKTIEEKEALKEAYFKDDRNARDIANARSLAVKALQTEELLRRKKAYEADITYGSASAIAFDYLYDDIEINPKRMVQRQGLPNFAVIDEVDSVLFDDATTPFTLSGTQKDEELAISEEEKKEYQRKIYLANYSILKIKSLSDELKKESRANGKSDSLILRVKDNNSYDALVNEDSEMLRRYDMTKALIIDENTKDYKLTTLGETIIFQYFYERDIKNILSKHRDEIIKMKDNGKYLFQEGADYTISSNGRIMMKPRAFARLITSGSIKELTDAFERFGLKELLDLSLQIDNAITAWFILKEDEDYMLSIPNDSKSDDERMISLVMNGRTAEGRVYSNGLQQAIEEKERYLKRGKVKIKETKIKSTLASIPTASFFERYEKVGGMTGTAAVNAFRELYGLETYEVPRNRPRQVKDRGDRLYPSTQTKNEAIFQEALSSYQKGQPVLLSTTSIDESIALYKYLRKRFKQEGIAIEIPVLNANVDNLEEEAAIISKAGLPGAITISTEMAGRGTDIKLGGEVPNISSLIEETGEERVKAIMERERKKGTFEKIDEAKFEREIRKKVFSDKKALESMAQKKYANLLSTRNNAQKRVLAAGGLKVIGSGHFAYSRVDDQVKGRCGRQGDPGEVIFFNDQRDLLKIGVSKEKVDELQRRAEASPIIENPELGYSPLDGVIYSAQMRTETMVKEGIRNSQEIEKGVARYRKEFREQKEQMRRSGDYIDALEAMIEKTTEAIVKASTSRELPTIPRKTRLSRLKLDFSKLSSLSDEFMGIELSIDQLKEFKTVGELYDYMNDKGEKILQKRISVEGKGKVNAESEKVVNRLLSRAWNYFEGYVETIRHQRLNNQLVHYQMVEGQDEASIAMAYHHCVETETSKIVREIINPSYRTKYGEKAHEELVKIRVLPQGAQRVSDSFDEEIEQREEVDKDESVNRIKNLYPRPKMFSIIGNAILNRTVRKLTGIFHKSSPSDDEIETIEFESGKKR